MNYSKLFTVKTTMAKEDYHKFLYISTLLKSKMMIIVMVLFTAIISGLIFYSENQFDLIGFIYYWIILMIVAILATILKIEMKFRRIIKTDKTGSLDSEEVLDFYKDFLIVKSKVFEGEIKVKYAQFYEVFESKDYFITYLNANNATLIRKKDMESQVIDSLRSLYIKNLTNKYKRVNI